MVDLGRRALGVAVFEAIVGCYVAGDVVAFGQGVVAYPGGDVDGGRGARVSSKGATGVVVPLVCVGHVVPVAVTAIGRAG